MSDAPVDREDRPVMAAEVLARLDSSTCLSGPIAYWDASRSELVLTAPDDRIVVTMEDVEGIAANVVAALRACSSSGGPVVVGTDRTVRDYPTLTEDERELVEWCRDYGKHPVISLLQIIDRLAPPAPPAENQEDNDG